MSSLSDSRAAMSGGLFFWPREFSLKGYEMVFKTAQIWIAYGNSIKVTIVGTVFSILLSAVTAYPLSRRRLHGRSFIQMVFFFTMLFGGGMIPTYLVMRNLGVLNSIWVMVLPGALGVSQMIVTRTFLNSTIPDDLLQAAQIDGCNDFRFFFEFVLPLSKAVIAVIAMQYAISHWNSYFNAFIYLSDAKKYPLQIFLREILIMNQIDVSDVVDPESAIAMQGMADLLKYSLIIVATVPILCVYPFIQKYFVKGIMIGSLKG